jgi:hypothetical protein
VHDVICKAECARRRSVAAVGADHDARRDFLAVHGEPAVTHVGDFRSGAHVSAGGGRLLEEEAVEPLALRHVHERSACTPFEPVALVPQAAAHPVDDVLDDRFDREWQELRRAPGDAAAAGLVARELRLVDEQDARPRGREVIARKGPCRAGADDRDVAVHGGMLTCG